MAKRKASKKDRSRERRERRFEPRPSARPWVAYAFGAVGALGMGAGAWGQFGSALGLATAEPLAASPYILAVGALLVGIAIWLGTSGEPALRVGDAGVGIDKGAVRRVPWYAVEGVEWRGEVVRVTGKDETGEAVSIVAKLATQPQAGAWIVKEARERVPAVVDVPADATLPEANPHAGTTLALDPPQVVGRHCAASGQVISFEPDARLCPRCERVYHKAHVPEACVCGASLAELRAPAKTA
jgi:hypothetical protein